MAGAGVLAAGSTAAGAGDTWTPAGPLPVRVDAPVFALAADPADGARLLAGTGSGALLRSTDGGASWKVARAGLGRGVAALAFDPAHPGVALAGTRGAGVWRSADGGATWQQQAGTEARSVRAFAFAKGAVLAGGDQGVLASRDGGPWTAAGLAPVRVSARTARYASRASGPPSAAHSASRSFGDSSVRGHTWPNSTSSVKCTKPGANSPNAFLAPDGSFSSLTTVPFLVMLAIWVRTEG